ncbi:MAG TPA: phosphatidylserine decarboxylase family protein [Candidatus Hydrogenedentes bacterium]|nr:phosphatidylserine decarboxylase family protein [Candidatus Hydrogenedentota bacterium]
MHTFSAWKTGAPHYLTCLAIGLLIAAVFRNSYWGWAAAPFLLIGGFALFFFRDPPRVPSADSNEIVAPADGRIVVVDDLETCPYYDGPCKRIAIFLSLFNVHVNRSPVSGTVYRIEYKPGAFKPAMKTEASELNESNTLYMDSDQGRVTVRQISGLVARRIVCAAEEGQNLELGQKFGMIKFGSRTELYLPPDSEICVTLGEKVKAGTSIVARFQ